MCSANAFQFIRHMTSHSNGPIHAHNRWGGVGTPNLHCIYIYIYIYLLVQDRLKLITTFYSHTDIPIGDVTVGQAPVANGQILEPKIGQEIDQVEDSNRSFQESQMPEYRVVEYYPIILEADPLGTLAWDARQIGVLPFLDVGVVIIQSLIPHQSGFTCE